MKVGDLLKIGVEMLKILHENGISIDDYKYIPLFLEYQAMKEQGEKTTYVVAILSERYNLCERKVYKVLQAFLKAMARKCSRSFTISLWISSKTQTESLALEPTLDYELSSLDA